MKGVKSRKMPMRAHPIRVQGYVVPPFRNSRTIRLTDMSRPCDGSRPPQTTVPRGEVCARPTGPLALPQVLGSRQHLVDRVGDESNGDYSLHEAQRTERPDDRGLDDNEPNAYRSERDDQHAKQEDKPGHRAPAALVADGACQDVERVGHGTETSVGNRECFRDARRDHCLRTVLAVPSWEERVPHALDVPELESPQVARDEQPDKGECHNRHSLDVARGRIRPPERQISGRASASRLMPGCGGTRTANTITSVPTSVSTA